jgi:hypothetical protein
MLIFRARKHLPRNLHLQPACLLSPIENEAINISLVYKDYEAGLCMLAQEPVYRGQLQLEEKQVSIHLDS